MTNGIFGSNTYIVESNNQCAIIDCSNKPQDIKELLTAKIWSRNILFLLMAMPITFYAGRIKDATGALFASIKMSCLFIRMLIRMDIIYSDLILILTIPIPTVF